MKVKVAKDQKSSRKDDKDFKMQFKGKLICNGL